MTTYAKILEQLGAIWGTSFQPDRNNTCLILLENGMEVRLEPIKEEKDLLIGILLGLVTPGPAREILFRSALIANDASYPRFGTLAYSRRAGQLVLFEQLPFDNLTGEGLNQVLTKVIDKAVVWKRALQTGQAPI